MFIIISYGYTSEGPWCEVIGTTEHADEAIKLISDKCRAAHRIIEITFNDVKEYKY